MISNHLKSIRFLAFCATSTLGMLDFGSQVCTEQEWLTGTLMRVTERGLFVEVPMPDMEGGIWIPIMCLPPVAMTRNQNKNCY